jgi:hypothetical protein
VDITEVSSRVVSEQLLGCNLELPVPTSRTEVAAIDIVGWVLGRRSLALTVALIHNGVILGRAPVEVRRPDVAGAFPEIPGAERSGFRTTLDLSEIASKFEVRVRAIFEDNSQVDIGAIRGRHDSSRSETEIEEVFKVASGSSEPRLWGSRIERPMPGSHSEEYAINVEGWVMGRTSPAIAVELVRKGTVLRRVPLVIPRPDIAAQFPNIPGAERSGFQTTLGLLDLTLKFEVQVQAVLRDDSRVFVGTIQGQRQALQSDFRPTLQPLMVTSLGRMGTTWLMRMLSEHPDIVIGRRYPYELRTAKYWMHMLGVLSEPANHFQSANVDNFHSSRWSIGHNPYFSPPLTDDPDLRHWFGRVYVEQLAAFCQQSIDDCYRLVAAKQHQVEPVYFAEKHVPDDIPWLVWELYPEAREVFLVRDFRDVVCSILAYNSKRGYAAFGREGVNTDEEFIGKMGMSASSLLRGYRQRLKRAHLVRYEDLILNPVDTLGSFLEYLGLDSAGSTVESLLRKASEETWDMQHHRTISDPEMSIGRWRRDLDPSLQVVCQEVFGDVLEEFGYSE